MMTRSSGHNRDIMLQAQSRANEMRTWPSPLEERMLSFLKVHHIKFDFQKIFYIYNDDYIVRYFIADFFLPDYNLIIEVDGKFHDKHKQADRDRTKLLKLHYPGVEVIRFKWKDLSDGGKMKALLNRVK